ncbi:MAG TPA: chromosome segregation protein SMC [Anaerolineales bacterium]|nr:chromosome segregation protein SMC [Anaerolineales bacterium]
MPLKSLELAGYKTFAGKSTFLFADSITAVVGPNGSGKSNIADALRWVLGEQSYSLLRGKKTADMIFSGSQERAPAGMASATVTFDNSDGWLPIDFAEVAVTRRAYRDGQNEYLINNQKVRLRDVAELLGHSGLAERTYTIIGQGLVDAALSLKAEERRRLFEEAAGIGVYRTRKADALRRLDLTRRNLERVGDILSELRPRLRSLDRQARRVEEYEQVQADLHVLLRDWYGFHWHRGQNELTEARETARAREKDLAEVRSRKTGFDRQILDLRDRIHAHRSRLSGWQDELGKLRSQRERIGRELAVAEERLRALDERRISTDGDRGGLDEEVRLQEDRLERALSERDQLKQSADEARRVDDELQAALAAQTEQHEKDQEKRAEIERSLGETETRIAARAARLDALGTRHRELAETLSGLERDLEHARAEIEGQGRQAETARETLSQVEAHAAGLAQTGADRTRAAGVLQGDVENLRAEIAKKQTTAAGLAAQVEVLRQAEDSRAELSEGARALLDAGEAGRLGGVRGLLGRLIEAPGEAAAALAAALENHYDALFIETSGSAHAALDLLKTADSGAALVLVETDPLDKMPIPDGALGSLAEFVRCPDDLRPAVERLFGRIFLVEDRAAAERILPGLFAGCRVVTRDGVMFSKEGVISRSGSGLKGLVGRKQRIEALELELSGLISEIEGLNNLEVERSGELAGLRSNEAQLKNKLEAAQTAVDEARSMLQSLVSESEQAVARLQWQAARITGLRNEIGDIEAQIDEQQQDLSELEGRAESLRAGRDQARSQLDEVGLEDLQQQAAHWRTRMAVSQRAAEDAGARIDDRRAALKALEDRRTELDRQLEALAEQEQTLRRERELLKLEEQEVGERILHLKGLIEPVEIDLQELETRQDAVQESEAGARHALSATERNHSQAQITLARKQEALENLRSRIEDDFGLVSFEYAEDVSGPTPLPLGAFVESLPRVISVSPELGDSIKRQRAQLRRMGAINPDAKKEHDEVRERFEFLSTQLEDLNKAETDILEAVGELDLLMEREFRKTFDEVAREFRETFTRLFGGGSARLVLTDPEDLTETGVDIEAQLPGRRLQGLSLLSGGERSLTATALVLSLIKVSPTPFCVLDEVDAMLDEANVNRLADLLLELSERTQFIIITHNRNTVQAAETIYGITMGRDSTSQVLSLKLDEVMELV